MLIIQPASRRARGKRRRSKIGLAIAGGGPIGGMYELGVLRAMEEAIEGLLLTDLDVYVGVSSGAFLSAGLANRLSTTEMCRIFLTHDSDQAKFRPEIFLQPAMSEFGRRLLSVPRVLAGWLNELISRPLDTDVSDLLGRLGTLIPTGLLNNTAIESFLRSVFESHGRTNDFRALQHKLFVVSVNLDTGRTVRFGAPGFDHVPISRAVQASAALPGLYPPVEVEGNWYVDGALRRTLHASVAFDEGCDLVIGINPMVPFDASLAQINGRAVPENLMEGGLPAVLSQTFRTLLRSRMQVGLEKYQHQYDQSDLVIFEPNPDDVEMFFTNIFSYQSRVRVAEHAYRSTLDDLRTRYDQLAPTFAAHGLRLRREVLSDTERSMMGSLGHKPSRRTDITSRLHRALDDLDQSINTRH